MSELFAQQRDRWLLWLPPAMVAGAAAWLSAASDPHWALPGAAFVTATLAALGLAFFPGNMPGWVVFIRSVAAGLMALISAASLGACAAQVRTAIVARASYQGSDLPVRLEGWVVANEASERGPRLRLLVRTIEAQRAAPRYVRVSVATVGVLTPGRAARCRAVLGPPSGPLAPGAYDFARRAYFERLGATGFAFGRCRPAEFASPPNWFDRKRLALAAMRADLAAAIVAAAPGRGGGIAAALVTGDQSWVDTQTNHALRDSGLGHLLSVSGIHMGVVGGLVFALLLWTLSLISPIALRWPVKKIAAAGALVTLLGYLVISGSSVPALRAYVMACVAFGAILLDRPAISMRGLALAAMVVTLVFPESVLEPGFQMSFAATMALVALFEVVKRSAREPALPTPGPLIGALQAISRGIGGVLMISAVAGLASDPFAIYHFQRFSLYSMPANLIAAPIMSFLVAPMAVIAAVAAPFGLADLPLQMMASALDLIAAVGATFGERPEAVRAMPRPPDIAFLLSIGALLWGCLWRGLLRLGGIVFLGAAIALYAIAPKPVAAFDSDLRAVFVREIPSGWSLYAAPSRSTYARERLGAMLGISPHAIERLAPPEACSDSACTWGVGTNRMVLAFDEANLSAYCAEDVILISHADSHLQPQAECNPRLLIDGESLRREGGGFLYSAGEGVRLVRAHPPEVRRPWTPQAAAQDQE